MQNVDLALRLARQYLSNDSSRIALADAIALKDEGDIAGAIRRAARSLLFSVGALHRDYHRVEEMMIAEGCVSLTIPETVLVALSLDDLVMQKELGVNVRRHSWSRYEVIGKLEDLAIILDDIRSRSEPGNWDQPKAWQHACKRAWLRCQEELSRKGLEVRLVGPAGLQRVEISKRAS